MKNLSLLVFLFLLGAVYLNGQAVYEDERYVPLDDPLVN